MKGLKRSLYIFCLMELREAFIILLPIVIALNSLVLISGFLKSFHLMDGYWLTHISQINTLLICFLPYLLLIVLSDLIARRLMLERLICVLTSLSGLLVWRFLINDEVSLTSTTTASIFLVIPQCFFTAYALRYFFKTANYSFANTNFLSHSMITSMRYIIPVFITISINLLIGVLLSIITHNLSNTIHNNILVDLDLSNNAQLILFTLINSFFWSFGIHGSNLSNEIIRFINGGEVFGLNKEWQGVSDIFVTIGGAGATLGLILVILVKMKSEQNRVMAKASLPFSLFNINEMVIYGLPIAFNPIMILPFFLAPLVNILIINIFINLDLFTIQNTYISWMTPPLYGAYKISNGNFIAVLAQIFCIAASFFIYYPFIKKMDRIYNGSMKIPDLLKDSSNFFLSEAFQAKMENKYVDKQKNIYSEVKLADSTFRDIEEGRLETYVQPKIDVGTGKIVGGEILLRLIDKEGTVHTPYFLPALYQLGLSAEIDDRVVELVFDHLRDWQCVYKKIPKISINLDKFYLLDPFRVNDFIRKAKNHPGIIQIEITEHTYTKEIEELSAVVKKLRSNNIGISIDDFGAGYSSLGILMMLEADEIKFDRALIMQMVNEKGKVILEHSTALCDGLGYSIVAEGVETSEQLFEIKRLGIKMVQGFLTGKPMPADDFIKLFNLQQSSALVR